MVAADRRSVTSRRARLVGLTALVVGILLVIVAVPAFAQDVGEPGGPDLLIEPDRQSPPGVQVDGVPDIRVDVEGGEDEGLSRTVTIALLMGLAAIVPGLLLLMTTFTRFIVVLGLAKNALALQTVPPSQVLVGLSLFLTTFVMSPVFTQINDQAVQPFLAGSIAQGEALERGFEPLQEFMLAQTRDTDLELFVELSGEQVASAEDVPATTLIPAFVISELRTAFIIGFVIFIPFLLIDLVVAAVLMSMGMVMVPPVFISLPLKLLLFVLVDGWVLMIGSMVQSVNGLGLS